MNKRSLLNLAMCSLLLGSLPVGLVGCKDYDGDIKDLNTTTGDLSSQLSTLKTALDAANTAAANAANDAKAAAAKADSATQEAALAKKAAEEAKAEALAEVIKEVEAAKTEINADNAKELAALAGRIDGIEEGLSKIDMAKVEETIGSLSATIAEANKQLEAIKVQMAALDKLKADLSTVTSDVADLKTKVAAIDAIKADLNTVKAQAAANATAIATNASSISAVQGDITKINGELQKIAGSISTEVTNAVNTLAAQVLSKRLTSITLMPEYYVDGIPSIVFESLNYRKQVLKESKRADGSVTYDWVNAEDTEANNFNIVGSSTQAKYRLNPGTVTGEDIDIKGLGYVHQIAQTRAGEDLNKLIAVEKAEVSDNGVLTVNIKKVAGNINTPDQWDSRKFYTVSLKVPVAESHLFDKETEANVYSEFTRVKESEGYVGLVRLAKNLPELHDSVSHRESDPDRIIYGCYPNEADPSLAIYGPEIEVPYNAPFDLSSVIKASMTIYDEANGKSDISVIDDLAAYGLSIKYAVAKAPYLMGDNKTDQQAYAKISGNILTPVAASGSTDNKSIIGRQPIIRVMLVDDVNKNMVSVKYIKVKYVGDIAAVTLPEIAFSTNCGPESALYNMPWDVFAKNVLEKLNNGQGMSKNDFQSIYSNNGYSEIEVPKNDDGTDKWNPPYFSEDGWDESTGVIGWYMPYDYLYELSFGKNKERVYTATVTFKNSLGQYPDVILPIKWTVTPEVVKPVLGTFSSAVMTNNTLTIRPIKGEDGTATYQTDILSGKPANLFSNYEAVLNNAPNAMYAAQLANGTITNGADKKNDAHYGNLKNDSYRSYRALNAANDIQFTLNHKNNYDKYIVCNGGDVTLNWNDMINKLEVNSNYVNIRNFASFKLHIPAILSFQAVTPKVNKVDKFIANNGTSQTFDLNEWFQVNDYDGVKLTDVLGNSFYNITDVTYTVKGLGKDYATAASVNGVNISVDQNNGMLTYHNTDATVMIENGSKLFVDVVITHKWGVLRGTVVMTIKK